MLMLHQYHLSPFNEKVQRMLNYKGIAYTEKYWGLMDRKKVAAFNPTGKLPALEHNGTLVCDSTDMVHYIEAQFPDTPMIPADPKLRGIMHAIEDWADESLYFYEMHLRFTTPGNAERNIPRMVENESGFTQWFLKRVLAKGIQKITANQGIGRKSLEQLLTDVERHVQAVADMLGEDDWLLDNQLSVADLAVYAMFQALRDCQEAWQIMQRHPTVPAWMERLEQATNKRAEQ